MPSRTIVGTLSLSVEQPNTPTRPPLLMLHGLFGGAWYFEKYLRFFAALGWPAYALDVRGHHGSRPVADLGKVGIADFVADATEASSWIAARHEMQRPVVIGHSMGGLLAQKLAEADTVSAAVLLCSAPPRGIMLVTPTLLLKQVKHLPALLGSRALEGTPADHEELTFNRVPEGERAALVARLVPESGRVGREISLGTTRVDARAVRCPVLCVSAADDRFVPARVGARLAAKYHASHWVEPSHAHFIPWEPGWEQPAVDIERWLAHVVRRAADVGRQDALWRELKALIGDLVELAFFDGYTVRAELLSAPDGTGRRRVVYAVVEVKRPGERARYMPRHEKERESSPLEELVSVRAMDS